MGLFHFTSASARAITSDLASFMDFKPLFLKTFVVIPQRSRPYQTNLATSAFHPESISDFTPPMPPFSPSCIPHCTEPSRNQNTASKNCPRVFKSLAISFCSFLPTLTVSWNTPQAVCLPSSPGFRLAIRSLTKISISAHQLALANSIRATKQRCYCFFALTRFSCNQDV